MKDLGFQSRLATIRPDSKKDKDTVPDHAIDQVAERHGFLPREPVKRSFAEKKQSHLLSSTFAHQFQFIIALSRGRSKIG